MKTRTFFSLWIILIMVILSACTAQPQDEKPPITIGMIAQLSGGGSFLGPSESGAARAAADYINAHGGLLDTTVKVIVCDDATDAGTANDCAKRLIYDDKVVALFSAITSASREAVMPVIKEKGDILYFYNAIYEGHSCMDHMWVSGTMPENQIFPVIPYLQEQTGKNKWYFIGDDYNWPRMTADVSKVAFAANNSELLGEKYVPIGTTDYTAILQDIAEKKPDFVLLIVLPSDAVAFMTQFHSMGLDKNIQAIATLVEESTIKAMGPASEGLMVPVGYHTSIDSEKNREFLDFYANTYGKSAPIMNFIGMHTYDAVQLWAEAVKKAGTTETNAVEKVLPTVSYEGPTGKVNFDAVTRHAWVPISLLQIKGGVGTIIHSFGLVDPGKQCDFSQ